MYPEMKSADEQLNMAFRSSVSAVFEFFGETLHEQHEIASEAVDYLHLAILQATQGDQPC